jgi:ADP-heptose:LPS heptosyltransferase
VRGTNGHGSAMRGRYLVRNNLGFAYLRALDRLLAIVSAHRVDEKPAPERILVGIGGHLGDAVLATSALAAIRRALPTSRIGVAAPSWVASALDGHPAIDTMHRFDHWKINRSPVSLVGKLRTCVSTYREALSEIRSFAYDASIDLYPYYPNMSVLFAHAGIPVRVGYESGGGGPTQTRSAPWREDSHHIAVKQLQLVALLTGTAAGEPAYDLPSLTNDDEASTFEILRRSGLQDGYVVLHPGTGNPQKLWPASRWLKLATTLLLDGRQVVITGYGSREKALAALLHAEEPRLIDLCGQTTLRQLRIVIRGADLFVGCDSVAAHLAAASATPAVTIMAGMIDPRAWQPLSDTTVSLMHNVRCAGCFSGEKCSSMDCVREVTETDVIGAARAAEARAATTRNAAAR